MPRRRVSLSGLRAASAFIPTVCCARSPGTEGIPGDALEAVRRMRIATRAALAAGTRGMLVDVLAPGVRRASRTFDSRVHAIIVAGLVDSFAPALRPDAPKVRVCLPGPKAALDVKTFYTQRASKHSGRNEPVKVQDSGQSEKDIDGSKQQGIPVSSVEIDVLGGSQVSSTVAGLVIVDPPRDVNAIQDLRELVRSAVSFNIPVAILNHPQPGSVHEIAECAGEIPLEVSRFKTVFLLAPFAIRMADNASDDLTSGMLSVGATKSLGRYVLYYEFPGAWQLWRYQQADAGKSYIPNTVADFLQLATQQQNPQVKPGYLLCETWDDRPSEQALFSAVTRAVRDANEQQE